MAEQRRLLVVEDEPEARQGYELFLGLGLGQTPPTRQSSRKKESAKPGRPGGSAPEFEVTAVATGEEAIEAFKDGLRTGRPFVGGFFDVKLGAGLDGLETVRSLKQLDPRLRCVIVTAYHDRAVDDIQALFGDAFKSHWDYLNKPFTQGEIVQKARQMVAAWNQEELARTLQTQLIQSERLAAVGTLARSIGHEFGNILLRIMGKADIAASEKDPLRIPEHLAVIKKASERAAVIVRNMQSFSRGNRTPSGSLELTDLAEVIQEAVSLMQHELVKHNVKLDVSGVQPLAKIPLDRGALAQVLLNLMINATHAMPRGGSLKITTLEEPESVGCDVEDTGTGIAPEHLERIFEFGFSTKGDQGSGLGLALSRQMIEAHGGKLWARSQRGQGATFCIRIPKGVPPHGR